MMKEPLSWTAVATALAERTEEKKIIAEINRRGITFKIDWMDIEDFSALGATQDLLQALRQAKWDKTFQPDASRVEANLSKQEQQIRRLLGDNPNADMLHVVLGSILYLEKRRGEAIVQLRTAISIKPELASAHLYIGNLLLEDRESDEAISEYRYVLRSRPDSYDAHYGWAVALRQKGDLDAAAGKYREAIKLDPQEADAHWDLGRILFQKGDLPGTITEFRETVRLRPADAVAHEELGNALSHNNEYPEALKEFREAVRLHPQNAKAHEGLGVTEYAVNGNLDRTIEEFRTVLRIDPDNAGVKKGLDSALQTKSAAQSQNVHSDGACPDWSPKFDQIDDPALLGALQESRKQGWDKLFEAGVSQGVSLTEQIAQGEKTVDGMRAAYKTDEQIWQQIGVGQKPDVNPEGCKGVTGAALTAVCDQHLQKNGILGMEGTLDLMRCRAGVRQQPDTEFSASNPVSGKTYQPLEITNLRTSDATITDNGTLTIFFAIHDPTPDVPIGWTVGCDAGFVATRVAPPDAGSVNFSGFGMEAGGKAPSGSQIAVTFVLERAPQIPACDVSIYKDVTVNGISSQLHAMQTVKVRYVPSR